VKDSGDFGTVALWVGGWAGGGRVPVLHSCCWPTQGGGVYCYLPDFKPSDGIVL